MSFDLKVLVGDVALKNGDLETITGKDKLVQDILKIALTEAGANPINPWYGSFISSTLIGSNFDEDITMNVAKSQLQNSLETLKKLQELQVTENLQVVNPDEHIAAVAEISINRNGIDLRLFDVIIRVISKSFNQVSASFTANNV